MPQTLPSSSSTANPGVEVGAELAWDLATEAKVPRAFFINKYDDAEASFERVFNALRDRFGIQLCPALVPVKRNGKFELIDLVSMKHLQLR